MQEQRLEDSKISLEVELKRWQAKYNDLKGEHDGYKAKVEEQGLSLPVAHRNIREQRDKIAELQREISLKDIEIKVLTSKYELLREDYTAL